ncbi:MAG TPA: hypothetical protein VGS58_19215 [Candidatus Sulfopaludibacter sp.]|nr:hypothetical protein [Candidatus Sulfopaludibacter sp.]
MDCVSDAGDAAILYCADLRWRGFHAAMGSLLVSDAGAGAHTRTVLGRHRVVSSADEIRVEHPRLKISGCWRSMASPAKRTVYEQPEGSIVWDCLQPAAQVRMRIGERELTGLGYVECLTLTLPSWRLPIRFLRWGRFVSPSHALAWVDWQGEHATRFAVFNGRECSLGAASESEVTVEGASLRIDAGESLRAGRLNSTVLAGAPGLKRLFPASLFNIREQKWKSRGTLVSSGQASAGWVIHEVVDWEP